MSKRRWKFCISSGIFEQKSQLSLTTSLRRTRAAMSSAFLATACRAVSWHDLVSSDFRRALGCLPDVMSEIVIFVSSTGIY